MTQFSDKEIASLFKNKAFTKALDNYIASKFKVVKKYNSYEGEYDDPEFYFGDHQLNVEESSYGY